MEGNCNYCELLGTKPHCGNCRIMRVQSVECRVPRQVDCSLGEMLEYIATSEYPDERFMVGDYAIVQSCAGIKGKLKVILADFNHDIDENGATSPATFIIIGIDGGWNFGLASNKWETSELHNRLPLFEKMLPKEISEYAAVTAKKTATSGQNSTLVDTYNKLFPLSEIEVCGGNYYSFPGEGEQYALFNNQRARSLGFSWWLRSPFKNYGSYSCYINSETGYAYSLVEKEYRAVLGFSVKSKLQ